MTKAETIRAEREQAIEHLRGLLKPGATVYSIIRRVSRSGMSRNIDFYALIDNQPQWITSYVGKAIGSPQSMKNWREGLGLSVKGCGMDMCFHVVYELAHTLYPKGFTCIGERCPSNDHSNGDRVYTPHDHVTSGGYALRSDRI